MFNKTKFLLFCEKKKLKKIKKYVKDDYLCNAFVLTILNGYFEISEWFLNNAMCDDDISWVFGYFCENGNLKIAQWLLERKPDINISARNERAFVWACHQGHTEVAQWLQSLRPWLYKIIKFNYTLKSIVHTILTPHINTKKEQHFQRRKYLVWLHSSPSLHQTSILHPLPSELLREIALWC